MSTEIVEAAPPGHTSRDSAAATHLTRLLNAAQTLRRGECLLAFVVYAGFAVFITWPLATNPSGLLSGVSVAGDLGGSVAQVAYVVQHHINPFLPTPLHGLDAPHGLSQAWVENWGSFPGNVALFGLGYIFGAVAGSNIFLWLSFVLSGMSMFLLIRRLFGSFGAALLAGFTFAFFPFAVDKLNGHYQYMDGWVLVLGVWRMLEVARRPTARNALLAGAAVAFGMWWTPYFILIGGIAFVVMELVVLAVGWAEHRVRAASKAVVLAGLPIVAVFGGLGALTILAGGSATGTLRTQSIDQLYTYSARWLEWVLPDRNNLIFGGLTRSYLTNHLHGSNFSESSLYIGISVIALAAVGSVQAVRRSRLRRGGDLDIAVLATLSGLALALVAAWCSAPPTVQVLGVSVPTPPDAIFRLTSTWRVYTRFVELLELGLCIPLAYAVSRILRSRGWPLRVAIVVGLGVVLTLDLWSRPSVRTVSVSPPPEYVWLHDHPGGIVADWPLEPAAYPDYAPLFWQAYDHHPLFQGYADGSEDESMKLDMGDLREPTTAPYLADLGVRYIVVRPGDVGATLANLTRRRYRLRFASPVGSVWQVDARPARIRLDALAGFSLVEGGPGFEYRWMDAPGVLGIFARNCASCHGTVSFDSSSNGVPRMLTVRDQASDRVLTHVSIPAGRSVPVTVPDVRLSHGWARLSLSTDVPPTRPNGTDPRLLSISVGEPRFDIR